MSMWEPFAEQARRSIVVAQEIAQELGANHIDGDHIFIGVVCEAGSPAAEIMASYGATPESVRDAARRVLAHGKRNDEELVFTADGKRTIELAFQTAQELGQRYIALEHLAVGFLRAAGRNSKLLSELHIDADALRENLMEHVRAMAPQGAGTLFVSLDSVFERFSSDGTDGVEIQYLWNHLRQSVESKDIVEVLAYALWIARRTGWSSTEAAAHIQKFQEKAPE